ncbi:endonuclease/exonuclease/phosphatase family protein [Congregibacter variabilis]|uniref:Endonuclease/exonuclease/phosphatase family protein n=1 Tax=Congregibacter variabilis TaxID=3081200 RepID=A0ABZ0HYG9_9GAMM|nr:endonuclease/exonuclease/phosphatase family protein [Congregibacter sp. IMCC43200]
MILRLLTLIPFALFASPTIASVPGDEPITRHNIAACAQALQTQATASLQDFPQPLRLRSWNVMKFDLPGAREELQRMSHNADLVFLQESPRGTGRAPETQKYRYFSPGYSRGREASGVEIRSKIPADLVCQFTFTEPWLRTPKAVSAVRLPFRKSALLLINLHAINFTFTARHYRKNLAELSQLVQTHQGPIIVAGDFNHWNSWRALALRSWARTLDLAEVDFDPDWRSKHLGAHVDTIFIRGLSAIASAALPTTRSDHHAIMASIVLLEEPKDSAADNLVADGAPAPRH